jgi:hypothetical protein
MTSILAPVFLSIQARIIAETSIKHCVEDTGQLQDDNPAVSYPCALIGIDTADMRSIGQNAQMGTLAITITVALEPHSSTANNTPDTYKLKALTYYEVEREIHLALQGFAPTYQVLTTPADPLADPPTSDIYTDILADVTGRLDRVRSTTNRSQPNLVIRSIVYSLGIEDYGTAIIPIYAPATPVITAAIVTPDTLLIDL